MTGPCFLDWLYCYDKTLGLRMRKLDGHNGQYGQTWTNTDEREECLWCMVRYNRIFKGGRGTYLLSLTAVPYARSSAALATTLVVM